MQEEEVGLSRWSGHDSGHHQLAIPPTTITTITTAAAVGRCSPAEPVTHWLILVDALLSAFSKAVVLECCLALRVCNHLVSQCTFPCCCVIRSLSLFTQFLVVSPLHFSPSRLIDAFHGYLSSSFIPSCCFSSPNRPGRVLVSKLRFGQTNLVLLNIHTTPEDFFQSFRSGPHNISVHQDG